MQEESDDAEAFPFQRPSRLRPRKFSSDDEMSDDQ